MGEGGGREKKSMKREKRKGGEKEKERPCISSFDIPILKLALRLVEDKRGSEKRKRKVTFSEATHRQKKRKKGGGKG